MDLLKSGDYRGKILDYGVTKSRNGDPRPSILFGIEAEGEVRRVYWTGSFNGKALDYTLDALTICGLSAPRDLMYIAEGKISGKLNTEKTFDLVVSLTPASGEYKAYNRVEWIRDGAAKFKDAVTIQEFASMIKQQELISKFLEFQSRKGSSSSSDIF